MINTLTVQSRLILLACMPIILFIGATIFTLKEVKIIVHDLDELYDLRVIPMQEIKVVSDDYAVIIVDTFHRLRGGTVSKEQAIADILKAQEVARKNCQLYLKNVTSAEEKRLISSAEQQREKVDQLIAIYLSEIRENTFNSKDYSSFVKEVYNTFDPLSASFGDLINYQVKQAQLLKIEGDEEAEKVEFSLIFLSVVIVVAMSSVGFLIYKSINAPLSKMGQTIEQVVRDTDLTLRVEENGNDEFSKIAIDFNMMMDKFNAMLS